MNLPPSLLHNNYAWINIINKYFNGVVSDSIIYLVMLIISKDDYGYVALPIVQSGGVAIIVDYDLAPHGRPSINL